MASLSIGDNLEVGGMTGRNLDEIFIRCFEIDRQDTVMEYTHIVLWSGKTWTLIRTFELEIVDLLYVEGTGLYCLGARADLYLFDGKSWTTVNPGITPPIRVLILRVLPSGVYALGMNGLLLRLGAGGAWDRVTLPASQEMVLGLAETDRGEMFVCGTDGFFASGTAGGLVREEFPTNVDLNDVLVLDKAVFVCGQAATVLVRSDDEWSILDPGEADADLYQLEAYDGHILLAADSEILESTEGGIVPFANVESQRLVTIEDSLFSIGLTTVMRLVGGEWTEFDVSFDIPDIENMTARPL